MTSYVNLSQEKPALEPVNRVEFNAALIHFYRAELGRADHWRSRLDTTTNWAVVTTGAAISFAFGADDPGRHVVLLLVSVLVYFFLVIEARRYRHYDIWQNRRRLLEADYFAPMFMGYAPGQTWRDIMARDLMHPRFRISMFEALGWRIRRNYIWIFSMLALSWALKVAIHPHPLANLAEFIDRAAVPPLPGSLMLLLGLVFNSYLVYLGLATRNMRGASGEIVDYAYEADEVVPDGRRG